MKIDSLTHSFLTYLQNNNKKAGSRYPDEWLQQQAREYHAALQHTIQNLAQNPLNIEENIESLLHGIHQRCAQESYRIIQGSITGNAVINERPGTLRQSDELCMKRVPDLNCNDSKDLLFLSHGKMPAVTVHRLKGLGHHPETMTPQEKFVAINGQPAWLEANNFLQMTAYIDTHVSPEAGYYFLCAYYKEHFLQSSRQITPQERNIRQYIETEINRLSPLVNARFNGQKTELTPKEADAYHLVYTTYPSPVQTKMNLAEYAAGLSQKIIDLKAAQHSSNDIAEFCLQTMNDFLHIHPFMDANYRTIAIFLNTLLPHFGYDFVNWHDSTVKAVLEIPFGTNACDKTAAIAILREKLTPLDKALRMAAAKGEHAELRELLEIHPHLINTIDHNPQQGRTALHWAVLKKRRDCVYELIKFGAQYSILDKAGEQTAIDIHLANPDDIIKSYLMNHIIAKYKKNKAEEALIAAADLGDLAAVKLLSVDSAEAVHTQTQNMSIMRP